MSSLLPLIQNETIKVLRKNRFYVILLILIIIIPVFTYAQMKTVENNREKFNQDWRLELQQRITDIQNSLGSDRVPEEWKKYRRIVLQQLQYNLDHDINPSDPNGVTFTRTFLDNAVTLFIPLLVMAIASDIVSSERSTGTIKMLLTRPIRRWKVLLSKWIVLMMFTGIIVLLTALLSYLISGLVFGYGGWTYPIFTGFSLTGTDVNFETVHTVPSWLYMLMQLGLVWFSSIVVAALGFMISVLVRSTAASIVTLMATLIAGSILYNMASSWPAAKYLFMINLKLTDYLAGTPAPVEGMTLPFSLAVLTVWGAAGLIVAFRVFTKQDILN
ncbi:ABC transporter permease [Paenibacillus thiaminolyticus]|uniref:ABC transporter permease n=1 Tax=Paenibacillus thiaminolyticus TaxID=49283 RepID=A0AAP9DRT5_PANTH|nr:ABC transporter permease [Paenibacillus thiaminolyticus]MCY9535784.1 ABC transporter permease [Paenibacillus thiaminolyticus]MCY9605439.1 ABC transporter permease [Paenibacillus thiaminolyticus]MCY9608596.1 ABC transporter permease [Paenibacillus thiaminolyticus]MCY9613342.1 ABC transporter permease [Paenibacillus thiaminolyticus]MCY9619516.1 ABC transporter permease [Paenibacillus thiaminolyticus]